MNKIIKKITISGFRSIEKGTIKCDDINVFCGANDSGKSNVLRALNLFFNSETDFLTSLKFSDDYNKVAFAKAVRATKMKQQIKIRIYLNPPTSYRSLRKEKEVYLERSFDRNGAMSEKYSNDSKRSVITKLFNKISYIYIPALKGKQVLQYILGLIGSFQLIEENDIQSLNDKIKDKTEDLSEILEASGISINTSFGLPTLLSDFWEKLSVDTGYEKTSFIDQNIKGTGENRDLNPNFFKIPLTARGEGIKSKYVPPLLEWLNKNNTNQIYIWGVDEPENSLEFGLAEELAGLYYSVYAENVQCFLTTHSLAFMNPDENLEKNPQIFRCRKDEFGSTKFLLLSDLLKENDKLELFDDLGLLSVQKQLITEFRQHKKERDSLRKELIEIKEKLAEIEVNTKSIVLTEDINTNNLKTVLQASGFNLDETEIKSYEGCNNIQAAKLLADFINERFPNTTVIIHIDRDYRTDKEVKELEIKFTEINTIPFITFGTDIESHFLSPEHIHFCHPDIPIETANEIIQEAFNENIKEAIKLLRIKNFGEKHKNKHSQADEYLENLPKENPYKYVKGKTALKTLKQKIKDKSEENDNAQLLKASTFISDASLKEVSNELWPDT